MSLFNGGRNIRLNSKRKKNGNPLKMKAVDVVDEISGYGVTQMETVDNITGIHFFLAILQFASRFTKDTEVIMRTTRPPPPVRMRER